MVETQWFGIKVCNNKLQKETSFNNENCQSTRIYWKYTKSLKLILFFSVTNSRYRNKVLAQISQLKVALYFHWFYRFFCHVLKARTIYLFIINFQYLLRIILFSLMPIIYIKIGYSEIYLCFQCFLVFWFLFSVKGL